MDKDIQYTQPVVTAIIVTYNSHAYIGGALNSLHESQKTGLLQCIVVDNNSIDGSPDYIQQNYPWVHLIRSNKNVGFGQGCNLGFKDVRTSYVLIHNPDGQLSSFNLSKMIRFLDSHEKAGIVGPAITEGDQNLQEAGLMTTPLSLLKMSLGLKKALPEKRIISPGKPPFQTSWVCGAMMLIRSDLFRQLGGFDPRFFLYFEETDLCRRVTDSGMEIWAVGEALATHIGGASAKSTGEDMVSLCISEHFYCSRFYYLKKHFGFITSITVEILDYFIDRTRQWVNIIKGNQQKKTIRNRPFLHLPKKTEYLL